MEIELKTLTPIWTGGVTTDRMDRIHETGLIGSLRWWYEAIVRGLGGEACDPSAHSCIYDPEKPNNGLCDVCQVFGATGWRRRFRLVVQDTEILKTPLQNIRAKRSYTKTLKDGKTKTVIPTWYFGNDARQGDLKLILHSLDPKFNLDVVGGVIQFISDWAALGARPQMGFGVVEMKGDRLDSNPFNSLQLTGNGSNNNLPSLQNAFFARIKVENRIDQETFNLKYDLRRLFANDQTVRHFVMGTVQGDRMAAKIHMSRPNADGIIRVWGWIPEEANAWNNNWNRDGVLIQIKNHLGKERKTPKGKEIYDLISWREFNNSRDTNQQYTDIRAFLHSLWEGKE